MSKRSAGVLLHREGGDGIEVLLVHPGGPWWRTRDAGAWQLPKGLVEPGETPETAALREAQEELGVALQGALTPLGEVHQTGGKIVHGFALAQDIDAAHVRSNLFELEWPPRSGRMQHFPEIDKARWMPLAEARTAILESQRPLLDRLFAVLKA